MFKLPSLWQFCCSTWTYNDKLWPKTSTAIIPGSQITTSAPISAECQDLEKAMAPHSNTHLENPMEGGAWWAAVHGVATSWTRLHFHFSLLCIGEANGTPLQCSCLENPRDGRAWWAAVYGVTQSRTRLKRLSSSQDFGTSQVTLAVKNVLDNVEGVKRCRFDPRIRKIPWKRAWQSIPVFLPEESHGQRSLVGYHP